jgi:hypothetical protein
MCQEAAVARPNEGRAPGSKIMPIKLTTEEILDPQPESMPVACRKVNGQV